MDTREALRSFGAPIRDRAAPVHFAGRRDELDHILVNARHPAAGNTIEERDGERLGVPIPSMTKYLEDVAARRQTRKVE